jgi:hydrogenase nickel incorporation protein HypB
MSPRKIRLGFPVMEKNDRLASRNHGLFERNGLYVLNIIGSPGTGKTSLLEAMARELGESLVVIEGDVQTRRDADRIEKAGCTAVQIETGGACHLDAGMIGKAASGLGLEGRKWKVLAIENVGNLICPSGYDLGEHTKVGILSVTEGDDKILKYPSIFSRIGILVVNKTDLLPHVAFDVSRVEAECRSLNSGVVLFRTSATTGEGVKEFCSFILSERERSLPG